MTNQQDELVGAICALYQRAREDRLTQDDLVPLDEVQVPGNEDFLEKVYRDKSMFDHNLGHFGATYDIFRGFAADQVVLDVGSHWGYSVLAMRHQGCKAYVHSIEAMPLNIPPLERLRTIENGMYGYHNVAASDSEAVIRFYIPSLNGHANTGLATTGGTLRDHFALILAKMAQTYPPAEGTADRVGITVVEVPSKPIDMIVEEEIGRIGPIAAIKMDVEGHEGAAIRGARRVLASQAPLVMIEGANRNPEVVAEMSGHGYSHYERHDGKLSLHEGVSHHVDGFWVHPRNLATYRQLGIIAAEAS